MKLSLRSTVLAVLVAAAPAAAELEGTQRVVALAGWRYTPNDTFLASAVANNYQPEGVSWGGPQASASFGYSFTDWAELAVDIFIGTERLNFVDSPPLSSTTYGGAVGVRFQGELKLFNRSFVPALGVFTGPAFIYVSGLRALPPTETLIDSYTASVSGTSRITDSLGLTAEVRLLLTRGFVPGIGSINGGGAWIGVGVSWYLGQIPREQRGTLD